MPTDVFSCSRCPGRKFKSSQALHQHKLGAKGHSYCSTCQSDFAENNALLEHASVQHPGTACITCRRLFDSPDVLLRHFVESPRHPKCEVCVLGFPDKVSLRTHKNEAHVDRSHTGKNSKAELDRAQSVSRSSSPSQVSTESGVTVRRDSDSPSNFPVTDHPPAPGISSTEMTVQDTCNTVGEVVEVQEESRDMTPVQAESSGTFAEEEPTSEEVDQEVDSLLSDIAQLRADLGSFSLLDEADDLPLDHSADDFFGGRFGPFRQQWDQSPYLSSPRSINASRLPSFGTNSVLPLNKLIRPGRVADSGALPENRLDDSSPPRARPMHDSWHVSRPSSISSPSRRCCGIMSPSSRDMRSRLNLPPSLSSIQDEPEPEFDVVDDLSERVSDPTLTNPTTPEHENVPPAANAWVQGRRTPLEAIAEQNEEGIESSPFSANGSAMHLDSSVVTDSVDFSRVPSRHGDADGSYSTGDEEEGTERSSCSSAPPVLAVENLPRLALEITSPASEAAYSETGSDAESAYFDPFDLHPSRVNTPISATFPKRPRAWSFGHDSLRVASFGYESQSDEEEEDFPAQNPSAPRNDGYGEGLDAEAIALDEALPADIETDLFHDGDEAHDNGMPHELLSPVTAFESFPSEEGSLTAFGDSDNPIPGFAEDGHPLKSLITLDTTDPVKVSLADTIPPPRRSPVMSTVDDSLAEDGSLSSQSGPLTHQGHTLSLKCRICRNTPPRENVSATFCGHIFCRSCITNAVMASSKCPVCDTPTLLYCIFKLDLGL